MKDGTAPESIRRKGARGDLPVSLAEKIEILVFLSTYSDVKLSQEALRSLRHWNTQTKLGDRRRRITTQRFGRRRSDAPSGQCHRRADATRAPSTSEPSLR